MSIRYGRFDRRGSESPYSSSSVGKYLSTDRITILAFHLPSFEYLPLIHDHKTVNLRAFNKPMNLAHFEFSFDKRKS